MWCECVGLYRTCTSNVEVGPRVRLGHCHDKTTLSLGQVYSRDTGIERKDHDPVCVKVRETQTADMHTIPYFRATPQ